MSTDEFEILPPADQIASYDEIAGFVFQRCGGDALRGMFAKPEWCFFRHEIVDIANKLLAHGLKDAAKVMRELAENAELFPELPPAVRSYDSAYPLTHLSRERHKLREARGFGPFLS